MLRASETRELLRQELLRQVEGTPILEKRKLQFSLTNEFGFSFVFSPSLSFKYGSANVQSLVYFCHPYHGPRFKRLTHGKSLCRKNWEPRDFVSGVGLRMPSARRLEKTEEVLKVTLASFETFTGWQEKLLELDSIPATYDFFEDYLIGPAGLLFEMYADSFKASQEDWRVRWLGKGAKMHNDFSERLLADPEGFRS